MSRDTAPLPEVLAGPLLRRLSEIRQLDTRGFDVTFPPRDQES